MSPDWIIVPREWLASDGQGAGRWRLVAHRPCCPEAQDLCEHLHESPELARGCGQAQAAAGQLAGSVRRD